MKNIPKDIYLQIGSDCDAEDFSELYEVSWCEDKIERNDIHYVHWSELKKARARLSTLKAELETAREVISFYADPETYFAIGIFPDSPCGEFIDDFSETDDLGMKPGKRARAFLTPQTNKEG